ncbi:hypothetical protein HY523_01510 [Candidatus Berkelbacteria bacterium]|nr:hypothetical protein [Candidatus Berkelbacteria bacterium]
MPQSVQATRDISTHDVRRVFDIIADMERYPEIMPKSVEAVTVLRRAAGLTVTSWVTKIEGTGYQWTERDAIYGAPRYEIIFTMLQRGDPDWTAEQAYDFDDVHGRWKVDLLDNGKVRVILEMTFDQGIPELEELIGDSLKLKAQEAVEEMLDFIEVAVTENPTAA